MSARKKGSKSSAKKQEESHSKTKNAALLSYLEQRVQLSKPLSDRNILASSILEALLAEESDTLDHLLSEWVHAYQCRVKNNRQSITWCSTSSKANCHSSSTRQSQSSLKIAPSNTSTLGWLASSTTIQAKTCRTTSKDCSLEIPKRASCKG